jgi:hypothetical protein
MRTKLLLLSAAALVAGVASSMAQSNVYSVNVVGYVNQTLPAGALTAVANPLSDGTNTLDSVFGGLFPNKSTAQIWTGSGFSLSSRSGSWVPNFAIPPGVGVFVTAKTAYTNTYVGSVLANVGGSVTNVLPGGVLIFVGSQIPYAGTLNTSNLNLTSLPAKSQAQLWNGAGYDLSSLSGTWSPDRPVNVAQGFFLNSKAPTNWVQVLPAN